MADRVIAPVLIGVLLMLGALLTAAVYYVAFSFIPGGLFLRIAVIGGGAAVIAAIGVVVYQRIREIKEEDSNDYRNY